MNKQYDIDHTLLIKVCDELNSIIGVSPVIDTSLDDDTLMQIINKVAHLVDSRDNFSDDVFKVLLDTDNILETEVDLIAIKLSYDPQKKVEQLPCTNNVVMLKSGNRRNLKTNRRPHILRLEELISECRYTSKQIIKILETEFPGVKQATIANYVRSSKTASYTQFEYVAVEDENGVLRFNEML